MPEMPIIDVGSDAASIVGSAKSSESQQSFSDILDSRLATTHSVVGLIEVISGWCRLNHGPPPDFEECRIRLKNGASTLDSSIDDGSNSSNTSGSIDVEAHDFAGWGIYPSDKATLRPGEEKEFLAKHGKNRGCTRMWMKLREEAAAGTRKKGEWHQRTLDNNMRCVLRPGWQRDWRQWDCRSMEEPSSTKEGQEA